MREQRSAPGVLAWTPTPASDIPKPPSLEKEKELRHFLRLARPEWSCPRSNGQNNISRVIEKLRAIDVCDIESLVVRLEKNTLNDDLVAHGLVRFSKDAIDDLRRQTPFMRTLEVMEPPIIRQVGDYGSLRQMLSTRRITRGVGFADVRPNLPKVVTVAAAAKPKHVPMARSLPNFTFEMPDLPGRGTMHLRGTGDALRRPWAQTTSSADTSVDGGSVVYGAWLPGITPVASAMGSWPPTAKSSSVGHRNASDRFSSVQTSVTIPAATPLSTTSARLALGSLSPQHAPQAPQQAPATCDLPTPEQVRQMLKEGKTMQTGAVGARWSPLHLKTPGEHGEDMLHEQDAQDELTRFRRHINDADMRPHITAMIKQRLRTEADGLLAEGHHIQQRCMNIRKHVASMSNSRRELATLRSHMQLLTAADRESQWATSASGTAAPLPVPRDQKAKGEPIEKEVRVALRKSKTKILLRQGMPD